MFTLLLFLLLGLPLLLFLLLVLLLSPPALLLLLPVFELQVHGLRLLALLLLLVFLFSSVSGTPPQAASVAGTPRPRDAQRLKQTALLWSVSRNNFRGMSPPCSELSTFTWPAKTQRRANGTKRSPWQPKS